MLRSINYLEFLLVTKSSVAISLLPLYLSGKLLHLRLAAFCVVSSIDILLVAGLEPAHTGFLPIYQLNYTSKTFIFGMSLHQPSLSRAAFHFTPYRGLMCDGTYTCIGQTASTQLPPSSAPLDWCAALRLAKLFIG